MIMPKKKATKTPPPPHHQSVQPGRQQQMKPQSDSSVRDYRLSGELMERVALLVDQGGDEVATFGEDVTMGAGRSA